MKKLFYISNLLTLCLILSANLSRAQTPTLTINPISDTVCAGNAAMFTAFSADTNVHYTWEVYSSIWDSVHDGSVYSGASTDTLRFTATSGMDGYYYRVRAYNGAGISGYSPYVPLRIKAVGVISGATTVCSASPVTLTTTGVGGSWHVTNGNASISSTGRVTGISAGIDTILYIGSPECGADTAMHIVTVIISPSAGTITGATSLCIGSSATLVTTGSGGSWSATNGNASIVSSGMATGASNGIDTIYYVASNACGSDTARHIVTVGSSVSAGTISGSSTLCTTGSSDTLTASVSGGTWSALNGHASVVSGIVTGLSAGIDTIQYLVTGTCNADSTWKIITVSAPLTLGAITGSHSVCIGSTTTLIAPSTGGSWTASNGNASISTSGVVTPSVRGLDTITYSLTNTCGTYSSAGFVVTIDTTLGHAALSGAGYACTSGAAVSITSSIAGGVWTVSNSHASIDTAGSVTGLTPGFDSVIYTNTNGCSTDIAMQLIAVESPLSTGSITGSSSVCVGSSITLSSVAGGTWSVTDTTTARISSGGVVTGYARGLDTVMYVLSNSCGTSTSTLPIVVDTTLAHATVTGISLMCSSASDTLTASAAGGTWSASNASASVSTAGIISGSTSGIDTIMYTRTNGCSTDVATHVVTIDAPLSTGSISGATHLCYNLTTTLTSSVAGGIWAMSNFSATISSVGLVSGVTRGIDTAMYTITNACGTSTATHIMSIDSTTLHSALTGTTTFCIGSTVVITPSVTGGTWSVVNGNASAGSTTGMVTGVAAGMDTVIYTNVGACNTDTAMIIVTVEAPLTAGTISGAASACSGYPVSFTHTATGGTWSSSNTAVAVVDASGVVTGRGAGTSVISYSFTNSCGTVAALDTITIYSPASMIVGRDSVGIGFSNTYTDSAAGGSWSISDTTIATISSTGVVTGRDTGTATITYMVTNICGTSWSAKTIAVGPSPFAGSVFGPDSVCAGSSFSAAFGDTLVPGGVWSVSNGNATITSTGNLTGIVGGTLDTVIYTYTTGFGSTQATKTVIISSTPPVVSVYSPDSSRLGVSTGSFRLVGVPVGGTFTSLNTANVIFTTLTGDFVILRKANTDLVYSYTNACGTNTDTFKVLLVVNVNEVAANNTELNIFPNPNNGQFSINLESSINEAAHVSLSNMVGEVVYNSEIVTNKVSTMNTNLPAGIYMITVTTGNAKITKKVTITE